MIYWSIGFRDSFGTDKTSVTRISRAADGVGVVQGVYGHFYIACMHHRGHHGHVLRCPRRIGLASCRRPALIWRCSFTRSSDVHKMWPAQQSNIVNFDHRRRLKRALYEYLATVVQCARPKRRPPGGMAAGVSADMTFFCSYSSF